MRVLEDAWQIQGSFGPTVVTVGNFDGIHRGQRRVLETVVSRAAEIGAQSAVVTFEPHPLSILRAQRPPQRLTTPEQKCELIRLLGVDILANISFTEEFSRTSADDFVESFLHRRLGTRELYVGSSFGFGRAREGDVALLATLGESRGFRAIGIEEVCASDEVISSTRIRNAIREGDLAQASGMLGRSYAMTGTVIRGEGRGREHGWPTLNLDPDHDLLPADGVYASQVWLPSRSRAYGAVTNIGHRPTFPGEDGRVVETHVFDFGREAYGDRIELSFVKRLRGERRFPSATELVEQIGKDAEAAREYLAGEDCSTLVPTLGAAAPDLPNQTSS